MLIDWLSQIFSDSDFMVRSHCGAWPETFKVAYIVSNGAIAASYFFISTALYILWRRRRRNLVQPWILTCFASFILLCGVTHVCDVVVWWWAPYRLFTVIDFLTAVASVGTAVLMPNVVMYQLRVMTPEQYSRIVAGMDQAIRERDEAIGIVADTNAMLMRQVRELEMMRKAGLWTQDQERFLQGVKAKLTEGIVDVPPPS